MPVPFTEKEKTEIRNSLMEAGLRMFSGAGLSKTSVENLASSAGIAKGSFYLFFESKEELYYEILIEEEKFRDRVMERVLNMGLSPQKTMELFLLDSLDEIHKNPFFQRVFASDDMLYVARRVNETKLLENRLKDEQSMEHFLRVVYGDREKPDVPIFTGILRAFVMGVLHRKEIGEDIADTVAREMARTLARGLFPEPTGDNL